MDPIYFGILVLAAPVAIACWAAAIPDDGPDVHDGCTSGASAGPLRDRDGYLCEPTTPNLGDDDANRD